MSNHTLIIYKLNSLYHILEELSPDLDFKIIYVENEKSLSEKVTDLNNYLIITDKIYPDFDNNYLLEKFPLNIFKLIERINIKFLKQQFNNQSDFRINNYTIDLNSREIQMKNIKLKLTEKEINTIIYLSKEKRPVGINELQDKVWSYQSGIETHTVETHIYRLRKKIFKSFKDNKFILSEKNGYQIK